MPRYSLALTRARQPSRRDLPRSTPVLTTLLVMLILLTATSSLGAQSYSVTERAPFNARAVASPFVFGDEGGVPVRLDVRTGEKFILGHFGFGGAAHSAPFPSAMLIFQPIAQ